MSALSAMTRALGDFLEFPANHPIKQKKIQADNDGRHDIGHGVGPPMVDHVRHHRLRASQYHQWDQRKGNGKAQNNLGEKQDLERIKLQRDDYESGNNRDEAAQEDTKFDVQKSFDDDLPGHGSYRGGRQS